MRRRTARLRGLVDSRRPEDGPWLAHCAWCDRVALGEEWLESEVFRNQRTALQQGYRLTHGICPDCFTRVRAARTRR